MRSIYVSAIAAFVLNLAMTLAIPKGTFGTGADAVPMYNHIALVGINSAPELIRLAVGGAGPSCSSSSRSSASSSAAWLA